MSKYSSAAKDVGRAVKRLTSERAYQIPPQPTLPEEEGRRLMNGIYTEFENLASDKSFRDRRPIDHDQRYKEARQAAIHEIIQKYELNEIDSAEDPASVLGRFLTEMDMKTQEEYSIETAMWANIRGGPEPPPYTPRTVFYPAIIANHINKPKFENQARMLQTLKTTRASQDIRQHVGKFLTNPENATLQLALGRPAYIERQIGRGKTKRHKKRRTVKRFK